jgi:4-methyl-5(b-hydroxyethyl)-thiazole monophosphate biosynthesis
LSVDSFSLEGREVKTSYGLTITSDYLYHEIDIDVYDFLVVPGGKYATSNPSFQSNLRSILKSLNSKGRVLCLICAAPFFLKDTGILTGKNYTCFKGVERLINEGNYFNFPSVTDDNLITAKSAGYIKEFAFSIIEKLLSIDAVKKLKHELLLEN